jgi:hypothetical protein
MPLTQADQSAFNFRLDELMSSPDFFTTPDNDKGLYINQTLSSFIKEYQIDASEDKTQLEELSEQKLQKYRNENYIPRFIPKAEETQKYYEPLHFADTDTNDDKITKIDQWKEASLAKASALRPANSEDFSVHLNALANDQIRRVQGADVGWLGDKFKRVVQGTVEPISALAFGDEPTSRYFAENLAENPNMDQDFAAQVAAGIGDTAFQAGLAIFTGMAGGPKAAIGAMALYNSSRMMRRSYEEEMARSGDPDLALNSAVAQIPAAGLETFSDAFVFGTLGKLFPAAKSLRARFIAAPTVEAKRAILKEAIPTIGNLALKSGISEATVGGFAAEFASGYGSYLATGDEKYKRSMDELVRSGMVEGTVGLLFGATFSGTQRNQARRGIADSLQNANPSNLTMDVSVLQQRQQEIFQALKSGNYDNVVNILNAPINRAKPKTQTVRPAANGQTQYTKQDGTIFDHAHLGRLRSIKEKYDKATPEEKIEMQERYDRASEVLEQIENGTYKSKSEFDWTFSQDSDARFYKAEKDRLNPPRANKSYEVTLEDGSLLPNDDPSYILYTRSPIADNGVLNRLDAMNGKPTISLSDGGGKARIIWDRGKGKNPATMQRDMEFSVSTRPGKGKTPIAIYDTENSDGTVTRRVKILPKVKTADKFIKKDNYKYLESVFDNSGNLYAVRVEHNGKETVLYGADAYDVANKERAKTNTIAADKLVAKLKPATSNETKTPSSTEQKAQEQKEKGGGVQVLAPKTDEEASKGREFNQTEFSNMEEIGEGSESTVYKQGNKVIKVGEPYNSPESLPARVTEVLEADKLAGSGNLTYVGFWRGKNGILNPVFEQPLIEGRQATQEEVDAYMKSKGWTKTQDGKYELTNEKGTYSTTGDIVEGGNIVVDKDGNTVARDVSVFLKTPADNKNTLTDKDLSTIVGGVDVMTQVIKVYNALKAQKNLPNDVVEQAISFVEQKMEQVKDMQDPNDIRGDLLALWEFLVNARETNNKAATDVKPEEQESAQAPAPSQPLTEEQESALEEQEEAKQNEVKTLKDYEGRDIYIDGIFGRLTVDPNTNIALLTTRDGQTYETVNASLPVSEVTGFAENIPRIVKRNPPAINNRGVLINKKATPAAVQAASVAGLPESQPTLRQQDILDRLSKRRKKRVRTKKKAEEIVDKAATVQPVDRDSVEGVEDVEPEVAQEVKQTLAQKAKALEDAKARLATVKPGDILEADNKFTVVSNNGETIVATDEDGKQYPLKIDQIAYIYTPEEGGKIISKSSPKKEKSTAIAPTPAPTVKPTSEFVSQTVADIEIESVKPITIGAQQPINIFKNKKDQLWYVRNPDKTYTSVGYSLTNAVDNISDTNPKAVQAAIKEVVEADNASYNELVDLAKMGSFGVNAIAQEIKDRQKEDNNFIPFLKTKLGIDSSNPQDLAVALKQQNDPNYSRSLLGPAPVSVQQALQDVTGKETKDRPLEETLEGLATEELNELPDEVTEQDLMEPEASPALMSWAIRTADTVKNLTEFTKAGVDALGKRFKKFAKRIWTAVQALIIGIVGFGAINTGGAISESYIGNSPDIRVRPHEIVVQSLDASVLSDSVVIDGNVQNDPNVQQLPINILDSLPDVSSNVTVNPDINANISDAIPAPEQSNVSDTSKLRSWVLANENNEGAPFVIADKSTGKISMYDSAGKLVQESPALFGQDKGDILGNGKITPAGRFGINSTDITQDPEGHLGTVVDVSENRPLRLKTKNPKDNRISYGCINISEDVMSDTLLPLFKDGGVVYILPETEAGVDTFEGFSELPNTQNQGGRRNARRKKRKKQNTESPPPDQVDLDEDEDAQFAEEDVSHVIGKRSRFRKEVDKFIDSLQDVKIEQQLLIEEKPAYKAFKRVSYAFLKESDLREYARLFQDFVNTRSKVSDPQANRIRINEIMTKLAALEKLANQGRFNFLKETHPELLAGKNFEDDPFSGDISAVQDFIKQVEELEGLKDLTTTEEERIEYHNKIIELQEWIRERIRSGAIGNIDNLFSFLDSLTATGNPILDKANPIMQQFKEDAKNFYRDFIQVQTTVNPESIKSFRDVRNLYYSLLSIVTDGYPLASDTFITTKLANILSQQGVEFRNAFDKLGVPAVEKASSLATNIFRVAGTKKAADAIYALTSGYREALKAAERFEREVLTPYGNEIQRTREKQQGRPFNNEDHIKMGIYGYLRQHYLDETPTEGLFANKEWLKKSFDNYARTMDKKLNEGSKWQGEFLNQLMEGIEDGDPDAMVKMEQNAQRLLGNAQIGYVDDVVKLFEKLKPMDRFAQEFSYGRKFDEINNYIPAYSNQIRGPSKDGRAYHESKALNVSDVAFATDAESIATGRIGNARDRINTTGLSSTRVRHRVVGTNRALDLNINRLLENRGRLNALDSFTSFRRKELVTILKSPQFGEFIGDPEGQLGRSDFLYRIFKQSWQNVIQNASYLGKWHSVMNGLMQRFASFKLFSFYQLPAQAISNSITYFAQNINQPGKIMDFFKASSFIMANRDNPQFKELLDRLMTDLRNRSQEVILDKTASLDVDGKSIWQDFKKTNLFGTLRDIDNFRQEKMFLPFKYSDMMSGQPMLLAEYLNIEREKGRATDFASLTYNPESYFEALDATERMIGIGAASRRGLWLHNSNSSISLLRNLLTMFSSHRINNATNFGVALRDVMDTNLPIEDRERAGRFMIAVTAQTVAFGSVKAGLMIFLGQAIMSAAKGEEDEDLEKLFAQNKDNMSKKEREILEQEISTRRGIRAALNNFENRNSSARLLALNTGKDLLSNIWFASAFSEIPTDFLFHFTADDIEERSFKEFKEAELTRLNNLIKEENNPQARAKIMEKKSDLESQEAMKVVFENHGIVNLGGLVGPFIKENFDFAVETRDSLFEFGEIGLENAATLFGAYGIGSPDLSRYLKLREKIIHERVRGEEKKKEAIAKLYKDHE